MATKKKDAAATAAAPAPETKDAGKGKGKEIATVEAPVEPKEPGKIEQILALHKEGKTNAEIVALGFNKTTVAIQIAKHKKSIGTTQA